ncbi:MAG: hypothetical protein L0228_01950 [Planctomycetes bacterium]|nr:hypothetical protein [Planctomycetota bacterium]
MSVGSLGGIISSAAGAPLSQTAGSETERAQKESLAQSRQVDANQKAELAAGIGQTEQDQESSERDADGRRLWESPAKAGKERQDTEVVESTVRQSKDATGQSGTQLDLTG